MTTTTEPRLDETAVAELEASFRGEIVRPESPGYHDHRRIWNGSVDLVTADGEYVKASDDENADLFWGVRGGGGNFGIVTEFEFRAVPLGPTVVAGPVFWLMEDSPKVLRFYRDW